MRRCGKEACVSLARRLTVLLERRRAWVLARLTAALGSVPKLEMADDGQGSREPLGWPKGAPGGAFPSQYDESGMPGALKIGPRGLRSGPASIGWRPSCVASS